MTQKTGRPVVFGEVLYDCFEGGSEVLGGAPFNVAWHLHGFGFNPLFLSRVGRDELGQGIQEQMRAWGMDSHGLQWDDQHPTGTVRIRLQQGQPSFEILPAQAYDFIALDKLATRLQPEQIPLLYHGSLALRSEQTRTGLMRFIRDYRLPVFTDINLRAPWWERGQVREMIRQARWAKLNDDELRQITGAALTDTEELLAGGAKLLHEYGLELLVLTMGVAGAAMVSTTGHCMDAPPHLAEIEDTVGAGDAFSSVCIAGLLQGWPLALTLERALEFAARVCTVRGALIKEQQVYQYYRQKWNLNK